MMDAVPEHPDRDAMIAVVWQRVRPSAAGKVATLRTALEVLRAGGETADLDDTAAVNAHRLTGSLGTYGFAEASAAAAMAERFFTGEEPMDLEALSAAIAIMEAAVEGE